MQGLFADALQVTQSTGLCSRTIICLKVGYGICEMPADFENTQLKWSYPLSFNADSDSTHSKYMDAQSCTSEQMRESEPLAS